MRRILLLVSVAVLPAFAQAYTGPRPAKPDLPYIRHADHLVPTEAVTAKEERKHNESVYTVDGTVSSARTPLVLPVFLLLADKLNPDSLGLYRMETKGGHREVTVAVGRSNDAIRLDVKNLGGKLYSIETDDALEPGEYVLSPQGSDQAFCFQVF
jgi:hypothetical protein